MRLAVVVALLGLPAIATADVWKNRVVYPEPSEVGVAHLTASSKILYVNDCLPNGCTVTKGTDSSITNSSSIPDAASVHLDAYPHGAMHWDQVIACVKETMAPFDIQVVTADPGSASHYEVMVGGTAAQLQPGLEAGGIAPFISCNAARNNVLVFVFAGQTGTIPYLCAAIAHEAGHAYGLSHSLDALDPMTYMDLGSTKIWQNSDAQCGTSSVEPCRCTGSTQNTFRTLQTTWGLNPAVGDAGLTLFTPKDGQWVRPNFPISGQLDSKLNMLSAAYKIDGTQIQQVTMAPLAFNAPALPAGDHTVVLTATDFGDRTVTATAKVKVMASCAAGESCGEGLTCFDDVCMPGADVAGGFGAACEGNGDCISGACASDGSAKYCSGACGADQACPSGYTCLEGAAVCWPEESGGCATSGGGSPAFALFGLGALAIVLRRRQR